MGNIKTSYRFQNLDCVLKDVIGKCVVYLNSYNTIKNHQLVTQKRICFCRNHLHNFDGAVFNSANASRIGAILHDDRGKVSFEMSRKEVNLLEVEDVETMAALRGL